MSLFRYKAVTSTGETVDGEMQARDRAAAVERLHELGYVPIRVDRPSSAQATRLRLLTPLACRRLTNRHAITLTQELASLLAAGVPLERALELLQEFSEHPRVEALLTRILDQLRSGSTLGDALESERSFFPAYYVSIVRAGEAGGTLAEALSRVAEAMAKAQTLRDQVIAALIYPMIVLIAAAVSLLILATVVVPEFMPIFDDANRDPPLFLQAIETITAFIASYWWAIALGMIAVVAILRQQLRRREFRIVWDRAFLGTPLIGDLIAKIEIARLSRTIGTLLANGISLLPALTMAKGTVRNLVLMQAIARASESLSHGTGLAEPMSQARYIPALALQLMRIGEESGQLDSMLIRIANIYDQEVARTAQRLLTILVPGVTLVLGIVIAAIMLPMMSALFSIYEVPL